MSKVTCYDLSTKTEGMRPEDSKGRGQPGLTRNYRIESQHGGSDSPGGPGRRKTATPASRVSGFTTGIIRQTMAPQL